MPEITSEDILEKMKDPMWRMDNLYLIRNQELSTEPVPMRLREEQRHYLENEHSRNYICKARQLGLSTIIVLKWLDEVLFNSNTTVATIDYREVDCKSKLEIASFAYRNGPMHPNPVIAQIWMKIHEHVQLVRENQSELEFSNGSKYIASMSVLGKSVKRLHCSEFAVIADEDVGRAYKIIQGSFPAVPQNGIITIETTMRGGVGPAAELFHAALVNEGREMSTLAFKFFFYSWTKKKEYRIPFHNTLELDQIHQTYFDYLNSVHNITLDDEQKNWYQEMYKTQRKFMKREFPTIPSECIQTQSVGQIYPEITELRTKKRVTNLEIDRSYPIYVSADLGFSDMTALWAVQFSGRDILIHRQYMRNGHGAAQTASVIRQWENEMNVQFAKVILPHDATRQGATYVRDLTQAGIPANKVMVVPRTTDVWEGINDIRDNIGRMWFDSSCDRKNQNSVGEEIPSGIECLELYKTTPSMPEKPFHDKIGISDAADALRTFFEAYGKGFISSKDTLEYKAINRNRPRQQIGDFVLL